MTWHAGSAVLAYDAQIAAAGITTVFDCFRIGSDEVDWRLGFGETFVPLADAVARAAEAGLLRTEHRTPLRCEVAAANVVAALDDFLASRAAHLISLMDHTPGQRQFRGLKKYFVYYGGISGCLRSEVEEAMRERQRISGPRALKNRPLIVAITRARGLALASHDDTTIAEVEQAHAEGVTIAEFATTLEAAAASRAFGMATVMGAPNVVRGGSHSGNVAARDLADAGHLDILSSDYVPAALLMAAFRLADSPALGGLPGGISLVSRAPARAVGLNDRGEIAVGLRRSPARRHPRRRAGGARGLARRPPCGVA